MLGLLVLFFIKTILVIVPLTVTFLAVRRLLRSKSGNAWLYAVTSMFAAITTVGVAPWAFGLGESHWVFFVFACMSPAVWIAVAILCNATRSVEYVDDVEWALRNLSDLWDLFGPRRTGSDRHDALILSDPVWPDNPVPVFRHSRAVAVTTPPPASDAQLSEEALAEERADTARRILSVARSMRRNPSSDSRRIKLLPPPHANGDTNLPFLKSSRSV